MSAPGEILAGVSLSLTGKFSLQGQEALNGLRLWVDHIFPSIPVRLIAYDDCSRADLTKENVLRLLTGDRVDLLLGPYSSALTMAVAPIAEAHGKILWNHGGASDAMYERGGRHLVSVVSPASEYLRALPLLVRQTVPEISRMGILHAKAGSFAAQVARGVVEAAKAAGFDQIHLIPFDSPIEDPTATLREASASDPPLLIAVGSFQDDVAVVRHRKRLPRVKALSAVGAGLGAMYQKVGRLTEGVVGPSQWEPGVRCENTVGPASAWFLAEYGTRFHQVPEYPAAQAFAAGLVFIECLRRAGSLEDEGLLAAAYALDLTTVFGKFRLDPGTGRQIGHQSLLVQWQEGKKVVVLPEEHAEAELRYPLSS